MCSSVISKIFCCALVIAMWATAVPAQEVRVGIGFSLPPYVIRGKDSGMEVDVIREALKAAGHKAHFVYLPSLRLPVDFLQGDIDGVAVNRGFDLERESGRKAYPSNMTVYFQNYAMTLRGSLLTIDEVKDLAGLSVLAFNNAPKYLGPSFGAVVRNNPRYYELADQALQVRMLYSGRVQVVVSDKRIFLWWRDKARKSFADKKLDMTAPVTFHPIFSPAPRVVYFNTPEIRDAFNEGLSRIVESGLYDQIISGYVDEDASQ